MKKYQPKLIEEKWQQLWEKDNLYKFDPESSKQKFYNLVELPYTSGDLHLGHWFAFTPPDAFARYKRMKGFNVFYPVGYDSFGLPAENAALKRNLHPKDWTLSNIESMQKQFYKMGTVIDWNYRIITCLPEYYRWNQWIFIQMFKKGIAYLDKALSNWCPSCQTVLADENVEAGKCWRCGTQIIKKEVEQWFLRLTAYADQLIWPDNPKVNWPNSVRVGQNNWIGRSEGLIIDFSGIKVFTTKPETVDGATFLVLAPEHPKVKELTTAEYKNDIESYIKEVESKSEQERKENKDKSGKFTGSYVKNPVTGEDIPVWISDYVLYGYGTGAIMAVPVADERDLEFAKKFNLPIKETSFKSTPAGEKKINYHIHDWSISRQRYWGTPVPIIHCDDCGLVPVPEEDLPVELPYEVDFTPKGKPPLATNEQWMKVRCPKCGKDALRDSQTLDGFFDNSWYFLRYIDPVYTDGPFNARLAEKLMPIDIYFGGAEHTLGHTLYARFFTKFLKDIGLLKIDEFALKRVQHGVILGPDGHRMSKSRGNVVNPDDVISEFGVDTVRVYLCFMMPYIETTAPWSASAIHGIYRFLNRVWDLQFKVQSSKFKADKLSTQDLHMIHKTIQKVSSDIEEISMNTAVAALMEWLNYLSKKEKISQEEYKIYLLLLAPFAPHITEELWHELGEQGSIHSQSWPKLDEQYLEKEEVEVAVQVNGKLREILMIQKDILNIQSDVEKMALESPKVQKFLEGKNPKKVIYIPGKILSIVV